MKDKKDLIFVVARIVRIVKIAEKDIFVYKRGISVFFALFLVMYFRIGYVYFTVKGMATF